MCVLCFVFFLKRRAKKERHARMTIDEFFFFFFFFFAKKERPPQQLPMICTHPMWEKSILCERVCASFCHNSFAFFGCSFLPLRELMKATEESERQKNHFLSPV